MRRHGIVSFVAIAALALGACTKQAAAPAASPDKGIAVTDGSLVLPAVKGNPGAAYFTIANKGDKPVRLASVEIEGAGMAMFHETMEMDGHSTMQDMTAPELKAGESISFAPGGKHVMVDGVPATLAPGSTAQITITGDNGEKVTAPLAVKAPGGAN